MKIRVSAVQYHLHTISHFREFEDQVTHYVKTAQEFDADFILFPEFVTTRLCCPSPSTDDAVHRRFAPLYR